MTQYVLRLAEALLDIGVDSLVLSDMAETEVPQQYIDIVIPGQDWTTLDSDTLRRFSKERPFVLHLHLSHPHHGSVIQAGILADVPTVVTCHEHRLKPEEYKRVQVEYCLLADKVIVSSRQEACELAQDNRLKERLVVEGDGGEQPLVFPVPPNITPVPGMLLDLPRKPGVVWFGMFRKGYDWNLLFEIAKEICRCLPGLPLHLVGASVNPRALLTVLDAFLAIDLSDLWAQALKRKAAIDRDVLASIRRRISTIERSELKLPNINFHLDLPPRDVSSLLAEQATCAIQMRTPDAWDHSGSLSALLAHGVPTVAAFISEDQWGRGKHRKDSLRDVVWIASGPSAEDTARITVETVSHLTLNRLAWCRANSGGIAYAEMRSQGALAAGCITAYQAALLARTAK